MPPINPDHLSPTGLRVMPAQALLVPMLAVALVQQGYSPESAKSMAESNWGRFEARPAPQMTPASVQAKCELIAGAYATYREATK